MSWRWLAPAALLGFLIVPAAAHADDGISYSPSPAYLGSSENFSACGFQPGETADLIIDNNSVAQATAEGGGCVHVSRDTPLDISPSTHMMSIKGESSGNEQPGVFLVMPPTIPAQPAPVPPGGVALVTGQFFAPLHSLMLMPAGGGVPVPGVSDFNGGLLAQIPVLPNATPGTYPVLIQDNSDPVWIANNQPTLLITVLPQPTDASGNWTLNATSTLTGTGVLDGIGRGGSTIVAQFSASSGQLKGQGTQNISVDMTPKDASCHAEAAPIQFTVGGSADASGFHLTLTGAGAPVALTATCDNGFKLPVTLPGGGSSQTFDIEGTDGKTVDIDGSNAFLMVPANFNGHTHIVLTKS